MVRSSTFLACGLLIATAGVLISLNGCGGGSQKGQIPPPTAGSIKHVVVIFQENRSPDNLFQDQKLIDAGANIQTYGFSAAQPGVKIPLTPVPMGCTPGNCQTYNPDHSHEPAFVDMCDLNPANNQCRMDGAYKIISSCAKPGTYCLNGKGNYSYAYVQQSDVTPYFTLAENYVFADNMFQSNQGPSFPAHQYLISGSSAAAPPGMTGDNLLLAENPLGISTGNSDTDTGCTAPVNEVVQLIDPATGLESKANEVYPCFDRPTLTDLLNAQGISWKYYAPSAGSIWTAPNAISHMCGPAHSTACTASDWTNNVVLNQKQILTDITNNQLRDVSWVIPSGQASDHAGMTDGTGPSWVASVVNAIGNSSYWADTAIFITWDDWGGWYDHVAPPQVLVNCAQWGCGYVYGFRVPLIAISPYVRANFISKQQHDFGSILKFIEVTFSLPSLGNADVAADDFSDCFDFNQTPLVFKTIQAPLNAQYFLNDKTPPTDPDDD